MEDQAAVYVPAIGIQFYRGIGPITQFIGPFSKMNFFVGPNNSGKSVILNFLNDWLPLYSGRGKAPSEPHGVEVYNGEETGPLASGLGIQLDRFLSSVRSNLAVTPEKLPYFQNIEKIARALAADGIIWIHAESANNQRSYWNPPAFEVIAKALTREEWYRTWQVLTGQSNGDIQQHWIPETLKALVAIQSIEIPQCVLIPAKRQIGPDGQAFDDQTGKGLISHLADIQNPDHHERHLETVFEDINKFLRLVTDRPNAKIQIPSKKNHVLVHMDSKVLPLSALGTGIHEVILIAAFCTINRDKVICLEEPEIHLHPILQRKLLRYLMENTKNQYFVATHSAAFIDFPNSAVFQVSNDGSQTHVKPALIREEKRALCADLGYKASDILQANAVIWVEGPSDRIYVRHWLTARDSELVEGIHYSIMFFGGSLISHLSAEDDALTEFIRLRELNKNMAIVLDSDRDAAEAPLKPAVHRISTELTTKSSLCWLTAGREVENYIPSALLQAALRACHPKLYENPSKVGKFDHAFYFQQKGDGTTRPKIYKDADKVAVARRVCAEPADLSVLDLGEKIEHLSRMIRAANEMPSR